MLRLCGENVNKVGSTGGNRTSHGLRGLVDDPKAIRYSISIFHRNHTLDEDSRLHYRKVFCV